MMTQKNSKDRIVHALVIHIVYAHENRIVDALANRVVYAIEIVYFAFMT